MNELKTTTLFLIVSTLCICLNYSFADQNQIKKPNQRSPFGIAKHAGRLEDSRLVECSGMDVSSTTPNLVWAINDGGNGPFLYALGYDGGSLGRLQIVGAHNRDWEGLDTFMWQKRPMILIADFGDNQERHESHTLYIVEEPGYDQNGFAEPAVVDVAWKIVFSYPDRKHDAEGVAVDVENGKVLVLTKRDSPPLLFEIPLRPAQDHVVAKHITAIPHMPTPTTEDLSQPYGKYRSQPTALDISPDGRQAVVLTYKHAYLFNRQSRGSWLQAFSVQPVTIPLPLPEDRLDLRQREALCYSPDGKSLIVTSEGRTAGIYLLSLRPDP